PAMFDVTVYQRMQDAEHVWRELEHQAPATVYQRFDFLDAWQSTLGVAAGVKPHIVVVKREGRAVALLPFGVGRIAGVPTLSFLGGKHCNMNIALIHNDFYADMTPATVEEILRKAISHGPAIGAVTLKNMPTVWDGRTNPLALNDCMSAASNLWLLPLEKDFATLLERRGGSKKTAATYRRRLNHLQKLGTVEMVYAARFEQYAELIDTFLQQKRHWLEERGIQSDMATSEFRNFLLSLAERSKVGDDRLLRISVLKVAGEVAATILGASFQNCYSMFSSSLSTDPAVTKSSPGDQLLHKLFEECCQSGHTICEFGIGRTPQKERWQKAGEPLVDLYRPVSARGMLLVSGLKLAQQAKRTLKENPALMTTVKTVRKKLGGRRL
ncbi:MAG: GNAT family N-acetyltransferase, partial [Alphaproteobacteria bacterium]